MRIFQHESFIHVGLKVGSRLRFYKLSTCSTPIVNYQCKLTLCDDLFSLISTIRRWMCTGECLQVYTGHTSFIYRSVSDLVISWRLIVFN